MKQQCVIFLLQAPVLTVTLAVAQVTLNPNPSRVLGHPQLPLVSVSPNLVEGREVYEPQGIALDSSASPPILYVADTGNNRVLAWKDASQFANGAPADLIIGQRDRFTSLPQGPGTAFSTGLSSPTGLAVRNGDLYVVDSGNNRILRFPRPSFTASEQFPDLVIGQPSFTARLANQGGLPTDRTVALQLGNAAPLRGFLAFDTNGNLYFSDAGNRRVLRYPASVLVAGNHGPPADLVIGQPDFITVNPALTANPNSNLLVRERFARPSGVALDSAGRLFVGDYDPASLESQVGFSRVVVFTPPLFNGMPARRIMGVILNDPGQPPITPELTDRVSMIRPEGIVILSGNRPGVLDSGSSRMLVFDPFDQWPAESAAFSPQARAVIGQLNDFSSRSANRRQPEPTASTLAAPSAAALAGNELFIADTLNNRIVALPQQGDSFGPATRVLGQDQFSSNSPNLIEGREFRFVLPTPQGIAAEGAVAIDSRSDPPRLYVADRYNSRILGFRDVRKLRPGDKADVVIGQPDMLRSLCNYPNGVPDRPTQSSLCLPTAVAVDKDGSVWVADNGNSRVLRFPDPFAQPGPPQADIVIGQSSFTGRIIDPSSRTMAAPFGLAFVGDNGLIVSDSAHHRVLFFPRVNGTFTSGMSATKVFGQPDFTSTGASSESNRMNSPRHVSADSDGRPYVADTGNNRVLIFDQISNIPERNAQPAVILPGLRAPRGVFVNEFTGEIWVSDGSGAGNRLLRFPKFFDLPLRNFAPDTTIPSPTLGVGLAQDRFGDLYVADTANRVAIYYPGMAAINGANFMVGRPLAPGLIASIFPRGGLFAQQERAFDSVPLPTELADTQVLLNNNPVPLFYVGPTQINFVVPMSAPSSGTAELQVIRKSTGQILAAGTVEMNVAAPGLFTQGNTGSGQVAALNQDGTVNSPNNPAPRGSIISLFGTGQGVVPGAPPDGALVEGEIRTPEMPRVIIGTDYVPDSDVLFSGLAPKLVGVWQINVRIPDRVAPSNTVPVSVNYRSQFSGDATRRTTIAVRQ